MGLMIRKNHFLMVRINRKCLAVDDDAGAGQRVEELEDGAGGAPSEADQGQDHGAGGARQRSVSSSYDYYYYYCCRCCCWC